ncbi:GNAT family N-acetyltransferase [Mesorhizobium sp. CAU 1741]|uniref:GNAT family N-acetyltransferase n=1 Tax=Mesorhizobium sp. CAU 1741 TaxID=3140366 RepID=UPI00325B2419
MMELETDRLVIRNWGEDDRALFHRINSDDEVMRFYDFRRSRPESDAFMDRVRRDNEERGYGFSALELKRTGQCIGFAGLQPVSILPARPAGATEIGWRLAPEFWGKGYATEAALRLLAFGFEQLAVDEIVAFAVWNNERSVAVMQRIGMTCEEGSDFDHPRVVAPELRRHVLYSVTADTWRSRPG